MLSFLSCFSPATNGYKLSERLTHKMGQLPDDQFEAVKQALRRLLK
jgi:hypothetical protein